MLAKKELKVISMTAVVIAISAFGSFAFKFAEYYEGQLLLPDMVIHLIMQVLVWTALYFVFRTIWEYHKLGS